MKPPPFFAARLRYVSWHVSLPSSRRWLRRRVYTAIMGPPPPLTSCSAWALMFVVFPAPFRNLGASTRGSVVDRLEPTVPCSCGRGRGPHVCGRCRLDPPRRGFLTCSGIALLLVEDVAWADDDPNPAWYRPRACSTLSSPIRRHLARYRRTEASQFRNLRHPSNRFAPALAKKLCCARLRAMFFAAPRSAPPRSPPPGRLAEPDDDIAEPFRTALEARARKAHSASVTAFFLLAWECLPTSAFLEAARAGRSASSEAGLFFFCYSAAPVFLRHSAALPDRGGRAGCPPFRLASLASEAYFLARPTRSRLLGAAGLSAVWVTVISSRSPLAMAIEDDRRTRVTRELLPRPCSTSHKCSDPHSSGCPEVRAPGDVSLRGGRCRRDAVGWIVTHSRGALVRAGRTWFARTANAARHQAFPMHRRAACDIMIPTHAFRTSIARSPGALPRADRDARGRLYTRYEQRARRAAEPLDAASISPVPISAFRRGRCDDPFGRHRRARRSTRASREDLRAQDLRWLGHAFLNHNGLRHTARGRRDAFERSVRFFDGTFRQGVSREARSARREHGSPGSSRCSQLGRRRLVRLEGLFLRLDDLRDRRRCAFSPCDAQGSRQLVVGPQSPYWRRSVRSPRHRLCVAAPKTPSFPARPGSTGSGAGFFRTNLEEGKYKRGGSTITMQLRAQLFPLAASRCRARRRGYLTWRSSRR